MDASCTAQQLLNSLIGYTVNSTDMKKNIQDPSPNKVDWPLILKIAVAVLSAILGAIAGTKSGAVADFINGII